MVGRGARTGVRRVAAAATVLAAGFAGVTIAPSPAGASVTWTTGSGYLQVTASGPGAESVSVTCDAVGTVRVNGTSTGLACAATVYVGVTGGPGDDTISVSGVGAGWSPALVGSSIRVEGRGGNDTIAASPLGGSYLGEGGDDTLGGLGGDDTFTGGPGNDTMTGGLGVNRYQGGPGVDSVLGGAGDDLVSVTFGDLPDDLVVGGTGYDNLVLHGSDGPDRAVVVPRADGGYDTVLQSAGSAELVRVDGSFEAHNIQTAGGDDQIHVRGTAPDPDGTGAGGGPLLVTSLTPSLQGGTDLLEVVMGGPFNSPAVGTYHRPGAGSVYFNPAETETSRVIELYPSGFHAFVHALDHDLGERHLGDAAVDAAADRLEAGTTTRAAHAAALVGTDAWRGLQVDRVYRLFLRRAPDAGGRAFWIGRIAAGRRIFDLRATVLASPEYFRVQGGDTNAGFVDAVYRDVLGRAADPGGRAYWIGRLDAGVPRYQIGLTLYGLAEPLRAEVRYQFRGLIGRDPSTTESTTWVARLRDRASGEQELHAFLGASNAYFVRTMD